MVVEAVGTVLRRAVHAFGIVLLLLLAMAASPALAQDFALTITDSPDPVAEGSNLTYTMTVANVSGPATLTAGDTLTFSLPSSTTYVSLTAASGWTCSGTSSFTCTVNATFTAATSTFSFVVNVGSDSGDRFFSGATLSVTGDTATGNNTPSGVATIVARPANLSIAMTASGDPSTVVAGTTISYTMVVSNAATPAGVGRALVMTDTLPGAFTWTSSAFSQWTCDAVPTTTLTCTRSTLAFGTSAFQISMAGRVPASTPAGTIVTNTATITSANTDPDGSNNTAFQSRTVVTSADLSISVTDTPDPATPGSNVTYTITVPNAGPSDAQTVVVSDALPAGMTVVSATPSSGSCGTTVPVTCTIPTIAASGSATVTIVATVPVTATGGSVLSNAPSVSAATSDPAGGNNTATAATTNIVVGSTPSTTVLVTSPNSSEAGQAVTLTATVIGSPGTPTGGVVFMDGATQIGTGVLAGGTAALTTSALTAGPHSLTAVYGGDATFAGSTSNTISQTVNAGPTPPTPTPPTPGATGSLGLAMSFVQERFFGTGETLGVTYVVTNTGTVAVAGIAVTDTKIPAISCPATTLAAGAAMTCTGSYVVTAGDVTAGQAVFAATATGTNSTAASASATIAGAAGAVAQQAGQATQAFLKARNALLAQGINPPGLSGGGPGVVALTEANGLPQLNFAASLSNPGVDAATGLALGEGRPAFNVWIDGRMALYARPAAGGAFTLLGMGADYLVADEVVLGVAAYVDWMRDSAAATQITGTGMLVGPYVSVGLGESLTFNASVFYGRSWNDISTTLFAQTFSGAFETERLMARARLEGEWMLDQLTLRPDVTLFLSREVSGDYVVRNAGGAAVTVAGTSVQEFRLSGGLSLETTVPLSDGLALTPTLGIRGGVAPGLGAGAVTDGFAVLSLGLALTGEHWTLKGVVEAQLETTGLRAGTVRGTLTGAF